MKGVKAKMKRLGFGEIEIGWVKGPDEAVFVQATSIRNRLRHMLKAEFPSEEVAQRMLITWAEQIVLDAMPSDEAILESMTKAQMLDMRKRCHEMVALIDDGDLRVYECATN